jgi:phosphoribosylglycinamide formyltransferase-1
MTARLAVLASGEGTNLQGLLDACADPAYGAEVVGVGSDRTGTTAIARATRHGAETYEAAVGDFPDRDMWDRALTDRVREWKPDLVVLAGFMKLVGASFLREFGGRCVNTHPALLPSFPGTHGVRDALEFGVKVTGATLFVVDSGVDSGPIVAQTAVDVRPDDDAESLHERIKHAERQMLVDAVGRMVREGYTIKGRSVTIP